MSRIVGSVSACGLAIVLAAAGSAVAQQGASTSPHVMSTTADLKWGQGPPALPKGAQLTVLYGDPGKAGPFAIRLRLPAGYRINPHWHPTDEHVTVIAGTFSMGMGDTFDAKALKALPAGGFALMPAEARHYAMTRGGATVQVHGTGPFALTYVNPADDPRTATK
jgi:quercetin dioxygenase-like cupin family protein